MGDTPAGGEILWPPLVGRWQEGCLCRGAANCPPPRAARPGGAVFGAAAVAVGSNIVVASTIVVTPTIIATVPTATAAHHGYPWPTRTMDAAVDLDVAALMQDQEDLEAASAVAAHLAVLRRFRQRLHASRCGRRPRYRGSVRGRRANKPRNFSAGLRSLLRDYFGVDGAPPVYSQPDFERRFRVPRVVFVRIYRALQDQPWWKQAVNATGRLQSHPLQKLVAAFRVLAYGEAADRADEYCRISSTTIDLAVKKLFEFIGDEYGPVYLRHPNDAEMAILMKRNAERGMPGCMRSLDCSQWEWKNCPKGQAGLYQNRKGRRTVVMETVCDEDLYIWHLLVGCPGSMNDLNVMQQSPLYHAVIAGDWPPRSSAFTVNGNLRTLPYYLVDGIYPHYAFFICSYANPNTEKRKTFNRLQEAIRKDVERLYAVSTARFHIAMHPARCARVTTICAAAKAVAILHNMVTELRRGGYLVRQRREFAAAVSGDVGGADGGDGPVDAAAGVGAPGGGGGGTAGCGTLAGLGGPPPVVLPIGQVAPDAFVRAMRAWKEVRSTRQHVQLRDDLAEDIYRDREALLEPYL